MSLLPIIIIIILSLAIGLLAHGRWRSWSLLIASILVIYWLQPATPIRHLDYWLPTACLSLASFGWIITRRKESLKNQADLITGLILILVVLIIGSTRYISAICCLTATPPPPIQQIIISVLTIIGISFLLIRFSSGRTGWIVGFSIIILGLFILIKSESLARLASMGLRAINSQSISLASGLDIRWLGFSYVAFRLLHTLRDRLSGKLSDLTLQDYVTYIIFFPAFTAGPIDRVQRFTQDLHQSSRLSLEKALLGSKRIFLGIFYKFVLADGLALIAMNNVNASQVDATGWLWVMLYAFALRIFFDFSGYTDIAIGMGHLLGIELPENFERPYAKPNLTLFWNSWHMTLAGWFRAYFFNPLTRSLRSQKVNLPLPIIIFIGQLSTFVLIGLWHGITWNFAIWGAWHGLGLFIHNRWANLVRSKSIYLENQPNLKKLVDATGTLLTFHYVSLGWVWFVLSTPEQSLKTLVKLFGFG